MKTIVNSDNFSAYLSRIPIDKSQKCALVEGIIYSERPKFFTKLLILSNIATDKLGNYLSQLLYNKNYKEILIRNGKKKSGEDFLNNQMIIKLHNM